MAFSFNSIGHFFAKAFQAITNELPKIEGTKGTVEAVTAAIPGGAAFVPVEDAAYAVLGAVSAVFSASGAAASAKLADAGLDIVAIQKVEALLAQIPQLAALAKALETPAAK
jgi:glycerate kinase